MIILFDIPDTVGKSTALSTGNFLLLETPIWQLDLVGEKNTAGHDVDEFELALDGSQSLLCVFPIGHGFDDLDPEEIIGIALKALIAICSHFILPIGFCDRRSDIVRVNATVRYGVIESDNIAIMDPLRTLGQV